MELKIGKFEVRVPFLLALIGVVAIDNTIANVCKARTYKVRCDTMKELGISEEETKDEESQ